MNGPIRISRRATLSPTRVGCAVITLLVLLSSLGALSSQALAATPSFCSTSYDPYTVSTATLQTCGDKLFPLTNVTPLADGGSAYHYEIEGMKASVLVPPASFDAADASAAELKLYGLEAPALDSPEWPFWEQMIGHMHTMPAPPAAQILLPRNEGNGPVDASAPAGGSPLAELSSRNWAGYDNYASSQKYHKATAYFQEPSTTRPCTNAAEVHWSGLGGVNSHNLAQAGTANYVEGMLSHQAWWEILPAGSAVVPEHASPGWWFKAETHYGGESGGEKKFYFNFYDYEDESYWNEEVTTAYASDLSTADYEVERPLHNGYYVPLADFGGLHFQGFTEGVSLAHYPYSSYYMSSGGSHIATPSGIPPSEYAFTDTWAGCGKEEAK